RLADGVFDDQRRSVDAGFARGKSARGAGRGFVLADEDPTEVGVGVVEPELDVGDQVGSGGEGVPAQAAYERRGTRVRQKIRSRLAAGDGPLRQEKEATDPSGFARRGLEAERAAFVAFAPRHQQTM